MHTVALVLSLLAGEAAFAVNLTYTCTGLWASPNAVLNAQVVVTGSFTPSGSSMTVDLNTELGGHLTGTFQGRDGKYAQGQFVFDNNAARPIPGTLIRITSVGGDHDGFRFDGGSVSAVFRCTR